MDPQFVVLAYDESNSVYDTVPISVDGALVSTDTLLYGPTGYYTFQAFDSTSGGAFNCFYDGSNYYSNSADINITQDETITVYYNYIPTYTVYFYAYDPGAGSVYVGAYVDGNYVGTTYCVASVPLGFHYITFDQEAWNDYLQTYENFQYMIDQNDVQYSGMELIPIVGDGGFTAIYET